MAISDSSPPVWWWRPNKRRPNAFLRIDSIATSQRGDRRFLSRFTALTNDFTQRGAKNNDLRSKLNEQVAKNAGLQNEFKEQNAKINSFQGEIARLLSEGRGLRDEICRLQSLSDVRKGERGSLRGKRMGDEERGGRRREEGTRKDKTLRILERPPFSSVN
ncbi:hypothetical protein GP486_008593 [Trichoglossum hirsutum]|uniref:Uncharacterized protein n=1 Tax=Trichoglossum hirsutum TaxID=265104 RepID=A0A9P8KZ34_9PEZI|nr:hypothetical protein GP486_008593 [Trichoglossum hirsutum]